MSRLDKEHQFHLIFDTAAEFDDTFKRRGAETGLFFKSGRALAVGDKVTIQISVKGIHGPVFLEGRVIWRRHRSGGSEMPAGFFIGLVDRDRARLDAIVKFFKSPKEKDRRQHLRFPVNIKATYNTSKGSFKSEIHNLSRGGAFLRCLGPLLTVGARFPLDLFLDEHGGKSVPLDVRVAWIDFFEDTQGMGVVFIKGQSQLKKVIRLIGNLERNLKKSKSISE